MLARALLSPLRGRGRYLRRAFVIVLPHDRLTRLIAVAAALKRVLLLDWGIPLPGILPLI